MRDKTRPPGSAPLPATTLTKVLVLTCREPLGEATHWTGRVMAKEVGISLRTVQRIWQAHGENVLSHPFERNEGAMPLPIRKEIISLPV